MVKRVLNVCGAQIHASVGRTQSYLSHLMGSCSLLGNFVEGGGLKSCPGHPPTLNKCRAGVPVSLAPGVVSYFVSLSAVSVEHIWGFIFAAIQPLEGQICNHGRSPLQMLQRQGLAMDLTVSGSSPSFAQSTVCLCWSCMCVWVGRRGRS